MKLKSSKKIRWGILSTGRMSKLFTEELQKIGANITSIYSRDILKAQRFSEGLGAQFVHQDLDEFLNPAEIDIVYIGSPNHLHITQSLQACMRNIAVICEKPAAIDSQVLGTFLSHLKSNSTPSPLWYEAFLYRSHPVYQTLKESLHKGDFGEILNISSSFGIEFPYNLEEFRFHKKFGGGALLDLGCYNLSLTTWLLQDNLLNATILSKNQATKNDVDTHINIQMLANSSDDQTNFKPAVTIDFTASFDGFIPAQMIVNTTKGKLVFNQPWLPDSSESRLDFLPTNSGTSESLLLHQGKGDIAWGREALHMEELLDAGQSQSPHMTWDDSLALSQLIQKIKDYPEDLLSS